FLVVVDCRFAAGAGLFPKLVHRHARQLAPDARHHRVRCSLARRPRWHSLCGYLVGQLAGYLRGDCWPCRGPCGTHGMAVVPHAQRPALSTRARKQAVGEFAADGTRLTNHYCALLATLRPKFSSSTSGRLLLTPSTPNAIIACCSGHVSG